MMVGTPEDILMQSARQSGALSQSKLIEIAGLEPSQAQAAIDGLLVEQRVDRADHRDNRHCSIHQSINQLQSDLQRTLAKLHQQNRPVQLGMPREQLRTEASSPQGLFDAIVEAGCLSAEIIENNAFVRLARPSPLFDRFQQAKVASC